MKNNVKRSSCIFEGKSYGIELFYTLIEGRQINVDNGMLEKFRMLGREKKLFCDCDAKCGVNVVIVAGERMLRRQHFKRIGEERVCCTAKEENPITTNSKILLKCWLMDKLNIENEELSYGKTIGSDFNSSRKFELTYYVEKKNLGLVYNRIGSNIKDDKLDNIESLNLSNCIYVCDVQNMNNNEQYPEFMYKVQKKQGFCLFLDVKYSETESNVMMPNYKSSRFYVIYCLKNAQGIWKKLQIVSGNVSDFCIDENGEITYRDRKVKEIVNSKYEKYRLDEQRKEEEKKRIREEKKRQEEIKNLQALYTFQKKEKYDEYVETQLKCEEQKDEEISLERKGIRKIEDQKIYEEYKKDFAKTCALYEYIKGLEWIEGNFFTRQSYGGDKNYKRRVHINDIEIDRKQNRIVIRDDSNERYLLYIEENDVKTKGCATGTFYNILNVNDISSDDLCIFFKESFLCYSKNKDVNIKVLCTLEDVKCQYVGKSRRCKNVESSCCYRKNAYE